MDGIFLQQMINGLTLGSVYGLIAIGYTMVYGIIGMINFAHGEVYMVSAYLSAIGLALLAFFGLHSFPLLILGTLIFTILVTGVYGWVIERIAYKPLRNSTRLAPLISAIGMSLILQNYVQLSQGARQQGDGKWVFRLEGGQVWRQIDTGELMRDPRPGGTATIRRAALGIIRLILENKLRLGLRGVLEQGYKSYGLGNTPLPVIGLLMDFFADRMKVALKEQGVRHDLVSAVFALGDEDDLTRLIARVDALKGFVESTDGANLLTAYKRAANIVRIEEKKDNARYDGGIDPAALVEEPERALNTALSIVSGAAKDAIAREDFTGAMSSMAQLRAPVDAFFDQVTVNDKDPKLRANRLRMLSAINATLSAVADFSKIEG